MFDRSQSTCLSSLYSTTDEGSAGNVNTNSCKFLVFLVKYRKIPVFRVTRPYLNLLVEPRLFFLGGGSGKYIILCILKGKIMPFKMLKIILSSEKKSLKNMCAYPT